MNKLAFTCVLFTFPLPYLVQAGTVRQYNSDQTSKATVEVVHDVEQTSKTTIMTKDDFDVLTQTIFEKSVRDSQKSLTTIEREDKTPLQIAFPLKVQGYNLAITKGAEIDGETQFLATLRDDSGTEIFADINEEIETIDKEGVRRCYKFADDVGNDEKIAATGGNHGALQDIKHYVTVKIDVSGSMGGGALEQAKQDVTAFLNDLPQNTTICRAFAFNHALTAIHSGDGQRCADIDLTGLQASGGTDIYGALRSEYQYYNTADLNPAAIKSVIAITDGYDNAGSLSQGALGELKQAKGETLSFVYFKGQQQSHESLIGISDSVTDHSRTSNCDPNPIEEDHWRTSLSKS